MIVSKYESYYLETLINLCRKEVDKYKGTCNWQDINCRLATELEAIAKTNSASAIILTKEAMDTLGITSNVISINGLFSGTLVSYLLGISDYNPLDYGIDVSTVFGENLDRPVSISINWPTSKIHELKNMWLGLDGVCQVVSSVIMEYDDKQDKMDMEVYPGAYFILFEDIDSSLSERFSVDGSEETYYSVYEAEQYYLKLCFVPSEIQQCIYEAYCQGTDLGIGNKDVQDLISEVYEGKYLFLDDVYDSSGLIHQYKINDIHSLQRALGLIHCDAEWQSCSDTLIRMRELMVEDMIVTRDDILDYCMRLGIKKTTSVQIMEFVRRGCACITGARQWVEFKRCLKNNEADEWFVWACERIHYLYPRAHIISYSHQLLRLIKVTIEMENKIYALRKMCEKYL